MNSNDEALNSAVAQILSVLDNRDSSPMHFKSKDASERLWQACKYVAAAAKIELTKPIKWCNDQSVAQAISAVAQASRLRTRRVALTQNWWEWDSGPLLVFDRAEVKPYALVNREGEGYQLFDPSTGLLEPLNKNRAAQLAVDAYSFYCPLPNVRLDFQSLVKFLFRQGMGADIRRLLLIEALVSLLSLWMPVATGVLLSVAIPNADLPLLLQWILGLTVVVLAMEGFRLIQGFAVMRVRFRLNLSTEAAVWDRLLRLPAQFFREFTPGDLATRAAGIDVIQQEITGAMLVAVLSGVFSLFTLALMFYYNLKLALGVAFFAVLLMAAMFGLAYIQLKYQRQIAQLQGKLASLQLQFFNGISKLRISGSEPRMFALWAERFATQNRARFHAVFNHIQFRVFQGLVLALATMWLLACVASSAALSLGVFIAFNAAFGQFFAAVIGLGNVLANIMRLIPLYERVTPILKALPELENAGISPGELRGVIELKDISFQYQADSPLVFLDLNMTIEAGEFVALVGRSGCGKSTLVRLLLGFETPNKGRILYDGQDFMRLNRQALRQQLGVVLQNNLLFAATIAENILGVANPLDLEAAWAAAERVGLAADIQAMPMQMHTLLSEGGKNLSMGQRQRVMIARALVHQPKILILDEATSALDNITQAKVMHSIEQLKMTRIVIAHRLSTLLHADRICVIESGKIVQTGTYRELLAQGGLFAELIQKQVV